MAITRNIEINGKSYTLTYDEGRVLDTITLKGDDKLIAANTTIGKRILNNAEKILVRKEVKGIRYL